MIALFKLASKLPLGVARLIGWMLGWLVWGLSPRYRAMMRANWALAARSGTIALSPAQARRAFRAAIGHAGLIASELPKIWCDPKASDRMTIVNRHHLDEAIARGKGVMILTPHLGAFELTPRVLAHHIPMTVLYRPAKQASLRRLMETLRPLPGLITAAPANALGVRSLLRALRKGEAIGMLPDQVPSEGDGVWADFFGRPAYTMTLPIRLAKSTGAAMIWVLTIRTQEGWQLRLTPWSVADDLGSEASAQALNQAIESQIAQAPEQYLWAYNRYKIPKGQTPPAQSPGAKEA